MTTAIPECTTRQADFRGWNACYLENGYIRLVAVPDIGGRIMAYDLGPYPFIFVDSDLAGKLFSAEENMGDGSLAAWKNYGGDKTWPAPQGWDTDAQWHGPPDPVLDTGRYTLNEMSSDANRAVVSMTSPPDPRTGVQITRHFTLGRGSSRVRVHLTFTNTTDKPIRWSIWDVIQLDGARHTDDGGLTHEPGCMITTPLNPESKFPTGFNVMFGEADNPQWQADRDTGLFKAPYLWEIGKVGLDSMAGWIAFNNAAAGYAFAAQFTPEPGADYPDDGVTVEVWTVGAGQVDSLNYAESDIYLMEAEVLSPLREIAPGESTAFDITWGVCRCPGPVVEVTAAGTLSAPLTAEAVTDDLVQLKAAGGVFDCGELFLDWLSADGAVLAVYTLGPVDPLALVTVDRVVRPPQAAAVARLRVTAQIDGADRVLSQATLS